MTNGRDVPQELGDRLYGLSHFWYNTGMERFFNIAGPCVAAKHYMLPATARLPEVDRMIRRGL